jgi:hypothetical protein
MFRRENDFLDILKERHDKLYGIIKVNSVLGLTPVLLIEKKNTFSIEYLDSVEFEFELNHLESILKHKSGFYLYLSKMEVTDISYQMKIYYDIDQLNEVSFFIKNLSKIK